MSVAGTSRDAFEHRLATRLVQSGRLDETALDRVWRLKAGNDERIETLLVKLGFSGERDVTHAMADELRLPVVALADYPDSPVIENRVTTPFLAHARVLPLTASDETVVLAMADPTDIYARRAIEMASGLRVEARIAVPSEFDAAYARLYPVTDAAANPGPATEAEGDDLSDDIDRLRDLASEAPVIRLVTGIITRAVEAGASDIHVEPYQNQLLVRYRIDGILDDVAEPPAALRAAVISRIKILAKLNIAERRLPQDGRIRTTVHGRDYDLRVSTSPSLHGETVVMRILDRSTLTRDLPALGFTDDTLGPFLDVLKRPNGVLLVTGPTGSGKTTTLYTSLMRLNARDKKLFTVEDPIEYQLEGVNQIQVKPQIGLNFAQILRSILRQDPDIIMVGEMRDLETAQIAIQAALTGHLVLSTLHTNSAAATVTRLLDMGVNAYLIPSTVTGVLAQRLVRKLCPDCREPYDAPPEFAACAVTQFYRPRGCSACRGSGYRDRIALMEVLVMTDAIRALVLRHADSGEIHRAAVAEGMISIYEDGVRKAARGLTSIEEVLRVTQDG